MSSSGTARAGIVYNLTCTVSKTVNGLANSPIAIWTIGGVVITNGNGITVTTMATNKSSISTLTFIPLRTSHGEQYSCEGMLTSPALDEPLMPSMIVELGVQSKLLTILSVTKST